MSDKKDFYIFLDHDGVFNFWRWIISAKEHKLGEKGFSYEFCPANLKVFNKILQTLRENNFNPKIVITSGRRDEKMQEFVSNFKKFGIDYDGEYDRTGGTQLYKMYEIATYAGRHNIGMNDSFVIIDDEVNEMRRHYDLDPSHFLQTSGLSGRGLNYKDFLRFKEDNLPKIMALSSEKENTL
ncbi:MAG: HAD domain-containing protein [Spirochaetales bacterium]